MGNEKQGIHIRSQTFINLDYHSFFKDVQGESINQTITFGPNDKSKAITFNIADDEVPFEPTEEFEIFLHGTHERYNILFDPNEKTTINILDDGMTYLFFL